MWGSHGDQNSEKHLKIQKVVKQQTWSLTTKISKYLEWCGPVTEGIPLFTLKIKIKHYIEDLIFKNCKNKDKNL